MTIDQIIEKLVAGTEQVIPRDELKRKLETGKKLRIKLGADPTAPDLHLGHAVVLSKLREFQDLGHEVIFLIGDFTTRIGDPTGKSKTRPPLSEETITANTKTYFEQVRKILDPAKITIRFNSEWLDKLTSRDWIQLCGKVTLARIIERDDFAKRMAAQQPIGFHELLYPLLQGFDSVALQADVELGGSDQTFNLLMGRHLQELYGQEPQVIMTTPLLEGLDGSEKMSKSLGNTIGLTEAPDQVFGKIMSISDALMWRYYQILLKKPVAEIAAAQAAVSRGEAHPMELKKQLASSILEKFWSAEAAELGRTAFEHCFQQRDFSCAQEVTVPATMATVWIVDLLKHLNAVASSSEARRLITEGALTWDGEKVTDFKAQITISGEHNLKVGKKKFFRIAIKK